MLGWRRQAGLTIRSFDGVHSDVRLEASHCGFAPAALVGCIAMLGRKQGLRVCTRSFGGCTAMLGWKQGLRVCTRSFGEVHSDVRQEAMDCGLALAGTATAASFYPADSL
jgi:hypothetical protein